MQAAGPSFFILGVLVTLVTADNSTSSLLNSSMSPNVSGTVATSITTTAPINTSDGSSITSSTGTGKNISQNSTTMQPTATVKTTNLPPTTASSGRSSAPTQNPEPASDSDDSTGIIILVVIIVTALGFGFACYFARKRQRRYSVDFNSRADEANIPLSTVDPDMAVGAVTQNGLKTFESADVSPKEVEKKDEALVEQKAEEENPSAAPSAEPEAPAKPLDGAEAQPAGSPVQLYPEEKTDDEGVNSNQTSVESLREANENNSNSGGERQQRDVFWDVPLGVSV